MAYPDFIEPRRECAKRDPTTGKACGTHVIERRGRWYCPVCAEMRSMATTVEVLGLPHSRRVTAR